MTDLSTKNAFLFNMGISTASHGDALLRATYTWPGAKIEKLKFWVMLILAIYGLSLQSNFVMEIVFLRLDFH